MNRRVLAAVTALLLVGLTGCQLAQPEMESPEGDRLVGLFITKEYLDLFDMEGYLEDNLSGAAAGGQLQVEGDTAPYEGRLYATLKDITLTAEDTGEEQVVQEFAFEGVEGFRFFAATQLGADGAEPYVGSTLDDGVAGGGLDLKYGDEEESMSLEGTLYVSADWDGTAYYFNPVYQSADGRVYATAGSGVSMSGDTGSGGSFGHTQSEETTVTEDGVTKTLRTEVEFHVTAMDPPERVVLLQMGADSAVLGRTEYAPGDLPLALTPEPGAAYLVAETHGRGLDGVEQVTYALYDREDKGVESFAPRPDGVCVPTYTQILWG